MGGISFGLTVLSCLIWLYLLGFRGRFWQVAPRLESQPQLALRPRLASHLPDNHTPDWPSVCVIMPARNEAALIPSSIKSLLTQSYPGALNIILVDDHSTDQTADIAQDTAAALGQSHRLQILASKSLPADWTGKLWALEQGLRQAMAFPPTGSTPPDYFLLTDADIDHDRANLERLVTTALQSDRELVSLMVRLRCQHPWEQFLIPAFVFFFAKLYPFRWSNQPHRSTAAAAGGCSLIRREALMRIGGLSSIRQALIDDCALAQAIKTSGSGRIWLGFSESTHSLRPYESLATIWQMVTRTAYTQLQYSPILLIGTVVGMVIVYLMPGVATLQGLITHHMGLVAIGVLTSGMMGFAYWPMIQFYRCPVGYVLSLPAIAVLYGLMTLDSAWQHWRGQGGDWKGRNYSHRQRN